MRPSKHKNFGGSPCVHVMAPSNFSYLKWDPPPHFLLQIWIWREISRILDPLSDFFRHFSNGAKLARLIGQKCHFHA